ncbi:site-specific DNA-methyltransferase [Curtobacterium poinsettiae]|uniref:site-specific DNA-methyltransferase n=1 Tax=Curtobacterium poinsettiae TaxID=159612 RepID=UPI0023614FE6|nr:DNA methyltransferase [Curtobacterium flaccumfaciens]MDD1386612.1 DNA methyltransferase [Curtobacterium flaccumfaciens pv. poinsettiae]
MARIHELLTQLRATSPALAADIEREVDALSDRRSFGLNFERHAPEAVELPGRKIRTGDKVRTQPLRGEKPTATGRALYRVVSIERRDGRRMASIAPLGAELEGAAAGGATELVDADDLVFVAEFRDPIHPGLVSTGKVERGSGTLDDPGDKPYHAVINAENFHALQALLFTHRGKVDAIYIDPPYNSGARDWKYNNDYVESDDLYRHSKWLAYMERRLLLAKELLNPEDSVLIVTIDEKEYLRLGLLLEQTFPEATIEMVTSIISAKGVARFGQFSRVEEYLFVVRFGSQEVGLGESNMLDETRSASARVGRPVEWLGLRRREPSARRGARPKQFYAIFVDEATGYVHSIGDPLTNEVDRLTVTAPDGTFAVWPLLPNGTEGLWGITPETARTYLAGGYLRSRNYKPSTGYVAVQYLPSGTVAAIEGGDIEVTSTAEDGAVIAIYRSAKGVIPKRVWNMPSHNAETSGTNIVSALLPGRRFPFPKSVFAVEDTLRFFVVDKPSATIVDFFAGSGTTAHAVMRLNKQDGGRRVSISVTNNEVGADEQKNLRKQGLRPGEAGWEQWGICDYITKPRIRAAITGVTPDGHAIKGDYKFTDAFPIADGFDENVEFFTLTYEAPMRVQSNREFARIAPFLWLRAGSRGRRIDSVETGWDVADAYGVISDLDQTEAFIAALAAKPGAKVAFIVTDEDRLFEAVVHDLPEGVEPVRMYEAYLRNFEIDAMRSVR